MINLNRKPIKVQQYILEEKYTMLVVQMMGPSSSAERDFSLPLGVRERLRKIPCSGEVSVVLQ
jgi:hypothetical protein